MEHYPKITISKNYQKLNVDLPKVGCKKVFPRYEIKEISYLGVVMLAAIIRLD
jgi:hypothetical protein